MQVKGKVLAKTKELEEDYEVYFLDESYINAHHVFETRMAIFTRYDKRKVSTGKGEHCGSSEKGGE